jgi:hypothetical protein
MEQIKKLFDTPAEHICRAIESCRTWDQLTTVHRWGTDVILSIGDHIALNEKREVVKWATEYKQAVLVRLKDCYVKQRNNVAGVAGSEYINIREVPEHVSVCRTCGGTGYLEEPAIHVCPICNGWGRVNVSTTVRTIISPFKEK